MPCNFSYELRSREVKKGFYISGYFIQNTATDCSGHRTNASFGKNLGTAWYYLLPCGPIGVFYAFYEGQCFYLCFPQNYLSWAWLWVSPQKKPRLYCLFRSLCWIPKCLSLYKACRNQLLFNSSKMNFLGILATPW